MLPATSVQELLDLDPVFALVRFEGKDASSFLQRQFTCDIGELGERRLLPGAWLNAKGRVLALVHLFQDDEAVVALTDRERAATLQQQLSRYVLRDRVTIALDPRHLVGRWQRPPEPGDGIWLQWPGDRWISASSKPGPDDPAARLRWLLEDVAQRVPHLGDISADRFLPQFLGLEDNGGISYRKGCFPGQEIVARTHYLGQLKRRLVRFKATTEVASGETLRDADGNPGAEVLQACRQPDDGWVGLAVARIVDHDGPALHAADGTQVTLVE